MMPFIYVESALSTDAGGDSGDNVYTIFATTPDGYVSSLASSYTQALDGNNLDTNIVDYLEVGQTREHGGFYIAQSGLLFDTSALSGKTLTAATLWLYLDTDNSAQDFTVEGAAFEWDPAIDTSDWRIPARLAAMTPTVTKMTTTIAAGYNAFVSAGLIDEINKTGTTYLWLWSSRNRLSNQPDTNLPENVRFVSSNGGGSTTGPKLVVTASN